MAREWNFTLALLFVDVVKKICLYYDKDDYRYNEDTQHVLRSVWAWQKFSVENPEHNSECGTEVSQCGKYSYGRSSAKGANLIKVQFSSFKISCDQMAREANGDTIGLSSSWPCSRFSLNFRSDNQRAIYSSLYIQKRNYNGPVVMMMATGGAASNSGRRKNKGI